MPTAKKKELWKALPGWEGFYEVSNAGRVRSLDRVIDRKLPDGSVYRYTRYRGKILKPGINTNGYPSVSIRSKPAQVHRLVALTWLDNPMKYPVVHHKDGCKTNNNIENLEWCTISYNVRESVKAGTHRGAFQRGIKNPAGRLTNKQVEWIRTLRSFGYSYPKLSQIFNITLGHISNIVNGRSRSTAEPNMSTRSVCNPIAVPRVCPM